MRARAAEKRIALETRAGAAKNDADRAGHVRNVSRDNTPVRCQIPFPSLSRSELRGHHPTRYTHRYTHLRRPAVSSAVDPPRFSATHIFAKPAAPASAALSAHLRYCNSSPPRRCPELGSPICVRRRRGFHSRDRPLPEAALATKAPRVTSISAPTSALLRPIKHSHHPVRSSIHGFLLR